MIGVKILKNTRIANNTVMLMIFNIAKIYKNYRPFYPKEYVNYLIDNCNLIIR